MTSLKPVPPPDERANKNHTMDRERFDERDDFGRPQIRMKREYRILYKSIQPFIWDLDSSLSNELLTDPEIIDLIIKKLLEKYDILKRQVLIGPEAITRQHKTWIDKWTPDKIFMREILSILKKYGVVL